MTLPLFIAWPALERRLAPVPLAELPTRVERLFALERELGVEGPLYAKRDDLTSSIYGGNKLRTLEMLFGLARAQGARHIVSVGAFGSNHAVASALHAARAGLVPQSILFEQPLSRACVENLRVSVARSASLTVLPHWSLVPWAMWRAESAAHFVMPPGGATPAGALGYVSAALELALQVSQGELPAPQRIVVGVGSTCTSAGLLVGLTHAVRLGIGFERVPELISVRVTPWPVTSRWRVLSLAARTSRHLAELAGAPALALSRSVLGRHFAVDGRELGEGYGLPTRAGLEAMQLFERFAGFRLDTTYSAKAAAGFIRAARETRDAALLFWSTKSSAPLPVVAESELTRAPSRVRRFLAQPLPEPG